MEWQKCIEIKLYSLIYYKIAIYVQLYFWNKSGIFGGHFVNIILKYLNIMWKTHSKNRYPSLKHADFRQNFSKSPNRCMLSPRELWVLIHTGAQNEGVASALNIKKGDKIPPTIVERRRQWSRVKRPIKGVCECKNFDLVVRNVNSLVY